MESQSIATLKMKLRKGITPEIAIQLGTIIGLNYKKVLIGRSVNPSGKMLNDALISGLLSAGADVTDGGIAPFPALAFASKDYDCTVLLYNPEDQKSTMGIIARNPDGSTFSDEQVRRLLRTSEELPALPEYDSVGTLREADNIIGDYIKLLSNTYEGLDSPTIIDCGCGSTGLCAPHILAKAGADLLAINAQIDENYVPRSLGVSHADIAGLADLIQTNVGSVGIAFNTDGTKMGLIDEGGRFISSDDVLALLLLYLKPRSLVIPLNMSSVVDDAFWGKIGRDVKTPVNSSENREIIRTDNDLIAVTNAMKENNAEIGAMSDGTVIFSDISLCSDAIYAAQILVKMSVDNSLREQIDSFPKYNYVEENIHFTGNYDIFSKRFQELLETTFEGDVMTLNGWRVEMPYGWIIISKNETAGDYIKILAESKDKVYLITMKEYIKSLVYSCL